MTVVWLVFFFSYFSCWQKFCFIQLFFLYLIFFYFSSSWTKLFSNFFLLFYFFFVFSKINVFFSSSDEEIFLFFSSQDVEWIKKKELFLIFWFFFFIIKPFLNIVFTSSHFDHFCLDNRICLINVFFSTWILFLWILKEFESVHVLIERN